jgi:hypothetical protein
MVPTMIPTTNLAIISRTHIFSIEARILLCNAAFTHRSMIPRISTDMRESIYFLRESLKYVWKINRRKTIQTLMGFTTFALLTLAATVNENTMTSFDTDSSIWVCDNSATGHIYNNRSLFTGDLVPSIFIVGVATGTSEPTLMGMVELRITDEKLNSWP